jgi:poly-gamma-glutamate synthesis protein (capsule biosynthesis protein)
LKEFDYVVANLESPLTSINKSWIPKSMHLRSPIVNIKLLKYLNIDAVSIANNHIHDYGQKGLGETISVLENNGIEWFGVNGKYLVKEINGEKICLSGFCCYSTNGTGYNNRKNDLGINTLTYDNVMKQLETDTKNNAFSILSFHWGTEHIKYPNIEHIALAHKMAERKDVLIHGHHPHVVQGFQKIKGSLIAYSLGNFMFDDCTSINGKFSLKQNEDNKKAFILEVEIRDNAIFEYGFKGFIDENQGLGFYDIREEIAEISKVIEKTHLGSSYELMRKEQFERAIQSKFGKHNVKWVMSRLNYYSMGARVTSIFRNRSYKQEVEKFLHG